MASNEDSVPDVADDDTGPVEVVNSFLLSFKIISERGFWGFGVLGLVLVLALALVVVVVLLLGLELVLALLVLLLVLVLVLVLCLVFSL